MKSFCKSSFRHEALASRNPLVREGQQIYCIARTRYPKQVDDLCGTEADCFFDDAKIDRFLSTLERKLNENLY